MNDGSKSAAMKLVRLRTGREPDELVRELYIDRRFSDQEIAEAIGVSRMTVNDWRRRWGISRDDRPAIEVPA